MKIPIRNIFIILIFITFVLLSIHSVIVLSNHLFVESPSTFVVTRFHLDKEANVPTWFSSMLLFSISATAIIIYFTGQIRSSAYYLQRSFWIIFSSVFLFLSLDEAAQFHEIIDKSFSVKWVFVYAPLAGVFFLLCLYFLIVVERDEHVVRRWIIFGLFFYALGGLFSEYISYKFSLPDALQQLEYVVEEALEILGAIMVLMGCFQKVNSITGNPDDFRDEREYQVSLQNIK